MRSFIARRPSRPFSQVRKSTNAGVRQSTHDRVFSPARARLSWPTDGDGMVMRAGSATWSAALAAAMLLAATPARAQSVDAQIEQLTQRVERVEGTRAVKKLQRAFGFYVDRGLWGEAADLFTDDGTVEIGVDGVY